MPSYDVSGAGDERASEEGWRTEASAALAGAIHLSTSQLNVSNLFVPCEGVLSWVQWQKRLRLSKDVDECKPLRAGGVGGGGGGGGVRGGGGVPRHVLGRR